MSTGLNTNPIVDINNSIPGAEQGNEADRPAAGLYPGAWYLSLDTKILYEWDGVAWNSILTGGVGSAPTLQQVTDASGSPATTTGNIFANRLSINDEANSREVVMKATDYLFTIAEDASSFGLEFANANGTQLTVKNNTGAILTDASVTYQLIDATPVIIGDTNIVIPHASAISPTSAIVFAAESDAATILSNAYHITWDNANVYVILVVPTAEPFTPSFHVTFYFIPA